MKNLKANNQVPSDNETEQAVLGALMMGAESFHIAGLNKSSFFKPEHQEIFQAIESLYSESQVIEIIPVTHKLRSVKSNVGAYELTQLTNRITATSNIGEHIAILKEFELRREMIKIGSKLLSGSLDNSMDPFNLASQSSTELSDISAGILRKQVSHVSDTMAKTMKNIDSIKSGEIIGVPSGIKSLDNITLGFEKGNVYIIAARPGMGKTALGLQFAIHAAALEKQVLFLSLEMSEDQLNQRILANISGVPLNWIRSNKMNDNEREKYYAAANNSFLKNIHTSDQSAIGIIEFIAACQNTQNHNGLDLVVLDYLQLMTGKGNNREEEISGISRRIKSAAKDFNVPIIALSQVNREVEKRATKKPMLSDLRESGSIEQDADTVLFLTRPGYYNTEISEKQTIINVAKSRHGSIGEIFADFDAPVMKFSEMELSRA